MSGISDCSRVCRDGDGDGGGGSRYLQSGNVMVQIACYTRGALTAVNNSHGVDHRSILIDGIASVYSNSRWQQAHLSLLIFASTQETNQTNRA